MITPGPWELFIVLLIVVVIFGAGRLSEIGGALGRGIKEFRTATKDEASKKDEAAKATAAATAKSEDSTIAPAPETLPTVARGAEASAELRCSSCGTMNPPSQTFCGQCGNRIANAA